MSSGKSWKEFERCSPPPLPLGLGCTRKEMTSFIPFGLGCAQPMDESQAASPPSSSHLAGSQTHRVLLAINLPRMQGGWKGENTPSLASEPPTP